MRRTISTALRCALPAVCLCLAVSCAKKPAAPAPAPAEAADATTEPAQPSPGRGGTLPERITAITIVDDRSRVSEPNRILNMPEWTIVGQKDQVFPAIGEREDRLIRNEIQRYSGPGPSEVAVDVYVLEGSQRFLAGERYEKITVSFGLRLEIASSTRVSDVVVTEGSASLDREALDVTYDALSATWSQAITESIHDALGPIATNQ